MKNTNNAHPRPLSPAEWAKQAGPEVTFSSEALTGMQEYAEYVAAYTHAAALQSAIDEINRTAFPGECLDRLFPVIESIKDISR